METHSLIWLFADDLFHQILFYFGTVVAMGILFWEKKTDEPIQWRWILSFFLFCLFVSCFQAWLDEHHNSERLIEEKLALSKQAGFWEGQSYAKDEAIRWRDSLLFENMKTLGVTQQTENQTQQSLTNLSGKIFDSTKPEPIRITNRAMVIIKAPDSPRTENIGILVAETNRRIGAFSGKIVCPSAFVAQQVSMLGMMSLQPSYKQEPGNALVNLDFNGSAWDAQEPIVALVYGDKLDIKKCSIMQQ